MVFPSLGCVTCKKRRVKCDSTRPICGRCSTANRSCSWESDGDTGLPFRNENAFAQGKARRPREKPGDRRQRNALALANPLSASLSVSIELQAFNYFQKNFSAWPVEMPDIGCDYLTYALGNWNRAGPGSSLQLAVSAFSHAVFFRQMRVSKAAEDADRFYARSIIQTQKEIKELSNERIDHLVVATLLMTNYENFMYGVKKRFVQNPCFSTPDDVGSRFWKNVCHYIGAVGLLQIRQQQGCPQNLPLYRAVRRPLIRACILRGDTVQEWLQDGALYGEEGPALELDALMVRVAALRSKTLKIFRQKNPARILQLNKSDISLEARDLDLALAAWPQDTPEEWRFSIHNLEEGSEQTKSSLLFNDSVRCYTTHGHAAVWMRYLAVRLIVNSILMRLLSALPQGPHQGPSIIERLKACQQDTGSLATDMCHSVPFFFDSSVIQHDVETATFTINDNITSPLMVPRIATLLSWPLSVAVSTEAVPVTQKEWLRIKLKVAAGVQGDAVVHSIAEMDEFKF